jgi:hypothetical protein
LTFILLAGTTVVAQQPTDSSKKNKNNDEIKTLFGKKKVKHGFYFSLGSGWAQVNTGDGFYSNSRLMWIMNHSFAWGFGGSGYSNEMMNDNAYGTISHGLSGGHGGLMLEWIVFPKQPIHLSISAMAGCGGIALTESYNYEYGDSDYYMEDSDFYLIAEPGAELELNLFKFMRLGLGASYRFTSPIHLYGFSHDVGTGLNIGASLKFGVF